MYVVGFGRISGSAGLFGIRREKAGLSVISGKVYRIIRLDIRHPAKKTRSGPALLMYIISCSIRIGYGGRDGGSIALHYKNISFIGMWRRTTERRLPWCRSRCATGGGRGWSGRCARPAPPGCPSPRSASTTKRRSSGRQGAVAIDLTDYNRFYGFAPLFFIFINLRVLKYKYL